MRKTMAFAAALALLAGMAPGLGDPYVVTKFLLVAVPGLVLALKAREESELVAPAAACWLAWSCLCMLATDTGYAFIGERLSPFDTSFGLAAVVLCLAAGAGSELGADGMARAVCWASLPMSAYSIFQRVVLMRDPFIPQGAAIPGVDRILGTQGSPLYLGACLAVVVVCAAYLMKRGSRLGAAAMAPAVLALAYTQTRGAMLAAVVGCMVAWRWWLPLALAPLALAARSAPVADAARWEVWRMAWQVFQDHPLIGYGPGNFYLAFRKYHTWEMVSTTGNSMFTQWHAHNDVLHVLAVGGLAGMAAYGYAWWRCVKATARAEGDVRWLLAGLLACYFVVSKFNPVAMSAVMVVALVLGAATARASADVDRAPGAICGLLVLAVSASLCVSEKFYADAVRYRNGGELLGEAAAYIRAAKFNPVDVQLACRKVDAVENLRALDPKAAKDTAKLALAMADEVLERHPMDSYAWELHGKSVLVAYMAGLGGDPRRALAEFERAQELAPRFKPLMFRRLVTARGLGDQVAMHRAAADIRSLDAHWGRD
jgi:O-antigen ligase